MHRIRIATRCLPAAAIAVLLLASLSCTSAKKETFEAAPFTLDTSLLSQPVTVPELGLQISPPLGWQAADSARLDAFRRMQAGSELSDKFYPIDCQTLYIDSVDGAIMYIAQIEDTDTPMPKVAKLYEDVLDANVQASSLMKAYYRIDDLDVYYLLHHTDQVINYKLLGQTRTGKKFLMEFVCSGRSFAGVEGAITSSIASLQNAGPGKTQPAE
jgi:hypothetical protein